jgi:ribosomal 50S subunit-recycling heat shock protein
MLGSKRAERLAKATATPPYDTSTITYENFPMRLDKWLKVSRILKRRMVAQMACDQNRVYVNDRPAKSSCELKVNDLVHLELGPRALTVRVSMIPNGNVPAPDASNLYELVEEIRRPPQILEWLPDDI